MLQIARFDIAGGAISRKRHQKASASEGWTADPRRQGRAGRSPGRITPPFLLKSSVIPAVVREVTSWFDACLNLHVASLFRSSRAIWTFLCLGVAAAGSAAAVGCMQPEQEDIGVGGDRVTEGASRSSALLQSTLLFENGCAGVKVGPRHVLTAARCVASTRTLVRGGSLSFVLGSSGRPTATGAARPADAGEPEEPAAGYQQAAITDVHVNPSFSTKCREDSCGLGSLVSSDAADVAVLELAEELAGVPALPVDLDPVGEADPLFVTMSECALLDSPAGSTVLNRTQAVPARSVVHAGSPYEQNDALVSRLASSYLVTAGPGWDEEAPGFCRDDVGGPVFRTGSAVVVGVTAGYTGWTRDRVTPATLHHTRMDDESREKVGSWLRTLGVETIHSCSESTDGCPRNTYSGGPPTPATGTSTDDGDGGLVDGGLVTERKPTRPKEDRIEVEQPEERTSTPSYDDDAGPKKTTKKTTTGCSASPTGASDATSGLAGSTFLAAAVLTMLGRRRRARG